MFKFKYTIVFLLAFCLKSRAQYLDTLHDIFQGKSNIDVRLETRSSFITHDRVLITGIRAGVAFKRKLRMGGGVSWLKSEVQQTTNTIVDYNIPETLPKYLKIAYLCYYIDFVFHKTKRWQLSIPIQVGTGLTWYEHSHTYSFNGPDSKYFLLLYEPGVTTQFKIFKWFGLGADVGCRFALTNKNIQTNLTSMVWAGKILFWLDQLYYETFPRSKLSEKYGPAFW